MGHFAKHTEIPKEKWLAAMEKVINPKFLEMNKKAFDLGYGA
jgi:indolepyruvate ferredoxin oxidoreductase beta subunit